MQRRQRWLFTLLTIAAGILALNSYSRRLAFDAFVHGASISELRLAMQEESHDARFATELARRFLLERRLVEAGLAIESALRANPHAVDALFLRGLLHVFANRPVAAMAAFEEVLRLQPNHASARLQLGILFLERSEFKKALPLFKEYVRQEPVDDGGYYWLGVAAFTSGYEKTGFWAMERAIQLAPRVANYHLALGGFCLNSKQSAQLVNKAMAELRQAVDLAPHDWMARYRLGAGYLRQNHLAEAAQQLEEAVRLNPRAYEPHFLLPQVFAQLGNREKANRYRRIAESLARSENLERPTGKSQEAGTLTPSSGMP